MVITGTSTGIGAASALLLAEKGFRVFAGVRNDADGDALVARSSGELTPVPIDITDEASISAAVDTVEGAVGDRGLFGLVNNAGIVKPAPLELQPMADFRRQLEVNLIGQVAVTQAFLPLIRRGNGPDRQRRIDRRPCGLAAPRRVQRVEVRHGGGQRRACGSSSGNGASRSRTSTPAPPRPRSSARRSRRSMRSRRRSTSEDTLSTTGRSRPSGALSRRRPPARRRSTTSPKTVAKALTAKKPKSRYLAGHGAEAAVALARTATDGMKDRAVAHEAHLPAPE